MRTILTLAASAALLASILGVAHAADTSEPTKTQPVPGATIGTPGAESKGNPIAVPDEASRATINQGSSANATTPGEESKGNTKGPPLTSQ
jgi:hypothetical protein